MNGAAGAAAAALGAGVVLSAHASARERVYGRSVQAEVLHVMAGAAIIAGLLALAWLAFTRWPDGGLPELGELLEFPSRWQEAA
jgi:hypothetical protein